MRYKRRGSVGRRSRGRRGYRKVMRKVRRVLKGVRARSIGRRL